MSAELISTIAILVACLSALYARWSVKEAKKSNDIGRLNSLHAFRGHYLDLIKHQYKLAELHAPDSEGMQITKNTCADLDKKLLEVSSEIDSYHEKVIANKI